MSGWGHKYIRDKKQTSKTNEVYKFIFRENAECRFNLIKHRYFVKEIFDGFSPSYSTWTLQNLKNFPDEQMDLVVAQVSRDCCQL